MGRNRKRKPPRFEEAQGLHRQKIILDLDEPYPYIRQVAAQAISEYYGDHGTK